ncbi:hypothetical protein ACFLUZ_05025 [Chloroflexota bacterium]
MIDVNVLTSGWTIAGVIASFLVAAIALGLGVSSLVQTQRLQKRERKDRLLNEIIEWAIDVADNAALGHRGVPSKLTADIKMTDYLHNIFHRYHKALVRSDIIKEIAFTFGGELYSSFMIVYQMTLDTSKDIIEYGKRNVTIEKLEYSETQLCKSAVNLIKEANKRKTKNIS